MRTSSPNQPDVRKSGISPFSLTGKSTKVSSQQNRISYDGPHVNAPVSIARYATKIASNYYSYVYGNPLRFTDASGLKTGWGPDDVTTSPATPGQPTISFNNGFTSTTYNVPAGTSLGSGPFVSPATTSALGLPPANPQAPSAVISDPTDHSLTSTLGITVSGTMPGVSLGLSFGIATSLDGFAFYGSFSAGSGVALGELSSASISLTTGAYTSMAAFSSLSVVTGPSGTIPGTPLSFGADVSVNPYTGAFNGSSGSWGLGFGAPVEGHLDVQVTGLWSPFGSLNYSPSPSASDPTSPSASDPTSPSATDPTGPGSTDPTSPSATDPTGPGSTDPTSPGSDD